MNQRFDNIEPTVLEWFEESTEEQRVERAINLLRNNEPPEGYYLAFSGGKDSVVIKELARLAEVRFQAYFNNTTIDAPEVIRFIRKFHSDVEWNNPKQNLFHAVATLPKMPPSRQFRWCCERYKEVRGKGRVKIFGVRAQESLRRARRWHEITTDTYNGISICPIVYWSEDNIWQFIKGRNVPYCSLYDEGFTRIGCVGCPLTSPEKQQIEFNRWPKYQQGWRRAIERNWERYHALPRLKDGKPRFQSKFATAEEMWRFWIQDKTRDVFRDGCQMSLLWTNEPDDEEEK